MRYRDLRKSSLNSALDRNYFLNRWVGDYSLVKLLQQNYNLDFLRNYGKKGYTLY